MQNRVLPVAVVTTVILVLVIVGGGAFISSRNASTTSSSSSNSISSSSSVSSSSSLSSQSSSESSISSVSSSSTSSSSETAHVFEDEYLSVNVPAGWTLTAAKNGTAVNIVKGNYILYINSQAQQASGVEGGRLSEITSGAPSADIVEKARPQGTCGPTDSAVIKTGLIRNDLFVNNSVDAGMCASPSNGSTVWYFSYVNNGSGYFNYYTDKTTGQKTSFVITMSYKTSSVNSLPVKGSSELNQRLNEMSDITKTLVLKHL